MPSDSKMASSGRDSQSQKGTQKQPEVPRSTEMPPTPPDGGWGWVVVFGSFMIHVIADGVAYSFGIFYIEFLDYFKGSRGATGWVGSLMVGITWASGPLASALTNKYGCRVVSIAGSFLSAIGFIISIWAPNIWFLYFSFGIVGGIGLGLIYLPAIVSVTYYFERRRSFATGLAVCGSGLGTFLFAPFTKYLVEEYTWQGAVLILAGLLLNCILCGALFRPLEMDKTAARDLDDLPVPSVMEEKQTLMNGGGGGGGGALANGKVPLPVDSDGDDDDGGTKRSKIANGGLSPASAVPLVVTKPDVSLSMQAIHRSCQVADTPMRSYASERLLHKSGGAEGEVKDRHGRPGGAGGGTEGRALSPMARKDIFYGHSLQNIPMYRSNPGLYTQSIVSLTKLDQEHAGAEDSAGSRSCQVCSEDMKQSFRDMMDLSLLKNPLFVLFAISNFLTSIGFCIPYMFLPDWAKLRGIEEQQAAFLISIIGIANTIGRVVFGFLSDLRFVNRLYLYNVALTICGVATSLGAFCHSYQLLSTYAAIFGVTLGVYVSLTSVVLVDLLGLECLTSSFGLTLLFQGIAGVIGPPIAGSIFDYTGSYDVPFYIMGAVIAASGFMLFCIPCVQRYLEHHDKVTQHDLDMGRKVADEEYVSSTLHVNAV